VASATPLYFSHPACHDHDCGAHPDRPERLLAIEAALAARGWLGYERRDAPPVDADCLLAVHAAEHVEAVRRRCETGGGLVGQETLVGPGSWEAALRAAGGACALVEALLAAGSGVGFAGTRPPGHHAARDVSAGFCLFNNVAVAARHALDALGAERVFILDWDVHHGDGTHDLFRDTPAVLYASIHQAGLYPGTGALHDVGVRAGEGYAINLPVPPRSDEDTWVSLIEHVVVPAATRYRPDLVLVSAGFDAHRDDPQGRCDLDADAFAEMARHVRALGEDVGAPVGAVLEGGYAPGPLAESVAATLAALASDEPPDSVAPDFVTSRAASHIGHYWTL
jgi:acetoin utilization deacetylase AcuC-like enzyme